MKPVLILIGVLLAGCSTKCPPPPSPASYWVRSDDYDEYRGLYLYSQTPEGQLWVTDYPKKDSAHPRHTKRVGAWMSAQTGISWHFSNQSNTLVYTLSPNGTYIQRSADSHAPARLMRFEVIDGRPVQIENAPP